MFQTMRIKPHMRQSIRLQAYSSLRSISSKTVQLKTRTQMHLKFSIARAKFNDLCESLFMATIYYEYTLFLREFPTTNDHYDQSEQQIYRYVEQNEIELFFLPAIFLDLKACFMHVRIQFNGQIFQHDSIRNFSCTRIL